jgi:hypothetical protein
MSVLEEVISVAPDTASRRATGSVVMARLQRWWQKGGGHERRATAAEE